MRSFKDNAGRTWTPAVNVSSIKRVRSLTGLNLYEAIEGKLVERLRMDPILLVDVVYALCKPEADQAEVSDEQFGQAMAGDAIDQATAALLEGLADFSPSPKDRANLRRVIEAMDRALDKGRDLIAAKIQSGVLDQAIDSALATASRRFGSAPASPASTPDP